MGRIQRLILDKLLVIIGIIDGFLCIWWGWRTGKFDFCILGGLVLFAVGMLVFSMIYKKIKEQ